MSNALLGDSPAPARDAPSMNRLATPLVSIITPTLNRADLLEQTLRSVATQTYSRVEHVVVDGGSTDGTLDLLRAWEGRYDLRWLSEPDEGMYYAINRGLRLARGEIVAYLNSDDLYFPWTIDSVVLRFQQDLRADFVYGDALLWDTLSGNTLAQWQTPFNLDHLRRSGVLVQPSVFWLHRVMAEGGAFDETLRLVADCDYWMRMGARHRFVKVDEFLAVERNHPTTLRMRERDAVEAELAMVRARYVTSSGPRNSIALGWYRVRLAVGRRFYLLRFIRAVRSVGSPEAIPWAGLLRSRLFEISPKATIGAFIPRIARRFLPRIVTPRPAWFRMLDGETYDFPENLKTSAMGSRP